MRKLAMVTGATLLACGGGGDAKPVSAKPPAANAPTAKAPSVVDTARVARGAGAPPGAACPPTGLWAECSILYRLERAGLAPRFDSSAKVDAGALHGASRTLVVKIGRLATLDVFLYPDSAARIAAEKTLDRSQFVSGEAEQTIRRERTLIENANLVGLFTSINSHQRERVADALGAGPPQPPSKP